VKRRRQRGEDKEERREDKKKGEEKAKAWLDKATRGMRMRACSFSLT